VVGLAAALPGGSSLVSNCEVIVMSVEFAGGGLLGNASTAASAKFNNKQTISILIFTAPHVINEK